MAKQSSIIRKVSLDRLSSPEQLDQRLTVVSPIGWAAMLSLLLLVLAALAWGIFGSVTNKVGGSGVLLNGGDVVTLSSPIDGQLADIHVREGDYIEKGQVIASLSKDELLLKIEECRENLAALDAIQAETLNLDSEALNYSVYPEFAQLAQQIKMAQAQTQAEAQAKEQAKERQAKIQQAEAQAQQAEAEKSRQELENDRSLREKEIKSLQNQIALLHSQINAYVNQLNNQYGEDVYEADLLDATNRYNYEQQRKAAEKEADEANARLQEKYEDTVREALNAAATAEPLGVYYVDNYGNPYRRNDLADRQILVYDQAGVGYTILTNSLNMEPVFYIDVNGIEQYNQHGSYYLPNYSQPTDSHTYNPATDPQLPSSGSAATYYDLNGRRYIDLTGKEFTYIPRPYPIIPEAPAQVLPDYPDEPPAISYGNRTRRQSPYDTTLVYMDQRLESLYQELEQAQMQFEQLDGSFTDSPSSGTDTDIASSLPGGVNTTGVQIAALTEQFAQTKALKQKDLQKQLDALQKQLEQTTVVAGASGTVLSVDAQKGDDVRAGATIGSVICETEADGNDSVVVLYVPVEQGKKIDAGMEVNVSPSTVNREEHGCIVGRVKSVSEYAVSPESMLSTLRNQQMVQAFMGESAVMEVRIELLRSDATESGYLWSTPKGAPITIDAGTICSGEVKVSSQRPIDMALPFFEELFA